MLKSIPDLIDFYQEVFEVEKQQESSLYRFRRPLQFRNTSIDLERLKTFRLPQSYINFISNYNTSAVSLGDLELSDQINPVNNDSQELHESLSGFNDPEGVDFLEGFVTVALIEADSVCLIGDEHGHSEDNVYYNEHANGRPPTKIADNFEQFLLIWANREYRLFTKQYVSDHHYETDVQMFMTKVFNFIKPNSTSELRQYWFRTLFFL